MHLGWPQLTVAALVLVGAGVSLARFGQQKSDNYDLFDVLIGPAILTGLLYAGGFWTGG